PVEPWRRRTNIEEFLDPYYGSGKSCDEMKDRGCIPKNELNDLIDGYLEDLDKLILKSRRGENYTLGNCNRKGTVISASKDPPKPRKTRPTITEVLDTYYVPDEPEKKPPQNVALGLGIDLKPLQTLLNECNDIMQRWVLEKEKCSRKPLDEKSEEEQKEKMKLKNVPEDVVGDKPRSAKDNEAKKNEIINYDSNRLYNLKLYSQNGASAIKEKKVAFNLDPIKDKCSETKDHEGLDENPQQSINLTHRTVFDPGGE
ncbi:46453_t:CDS:2, partial [Gigaspora margarita]